MSQPPAPSETAEIRYALGVQQANLIIEHRDQEWIEDSRALAQALWDTTPGSIEPTTGYLRGMLDTLIEYQHRGDEAP